MPGARLSALGKETGAGGSKRVPAGWMETMNRGCMPEPGAMGMRSAWTAVTETRPVGEPSGKVAEPAGTVSSKPGTCGTVTVTSSSPPATLPLARSSGRM